MVIDKFEHFIVVLLGKLRQREDPEPKFEPGCHSDIVHQKTGGEMAQRAKAPCFVHSFFGPGPTSLTSLTGICLPDTWLRHCQLPSLSHSSFRTYWDWALFSLCLWLLVPDSAQDLEGSCPSLISVELYRCQRRSGALVCPQVVEQWTGQTPTSLWGKIPCVPRPYLRFHLFSSIAVLPNLHVLTIV